MKSTIFGAVLGSAALLGALPLEAATFTPNVFDDPTPIAAPNGCTGQGSNPTRCSLREAALSANASAGADDIMLGAGTYELSILEAGTPASGDLDFSEGVPSGITIKGEGPANTKIQAVAGFNERILEVSGSDVSLTLQGISFEGGNSPNDGGAFSFSSGATNPVNILNCNFVGNKAVGSGGAVVVSGTDPIIVIDGGLYDNNESTAANAGAISLSHGATNSLDMVKNLTLTNNRALSGQGGAIRHGSANGISLSNIQVRGNRAETGGGIFVSNGNGGIALELLDSVISENTASSGDGGGVRGSGPGLFKIVNSTLSDNEAPGTNGGGAFISNGNGLQILGSTFSGNKAESGGGLFHEGSNGTIQEISNSTFSGNDADFSGGGLFLSRSDGAGFSLNNVTIADNTAADVGGGVTSDSFPVLLRNSILSGNSSSGSTDDCSGNFSSDGFNIFGSPNNQDCDPDGQNVGFNPDDIVGDALLAALADNGGPTLTHNLLAGSPALNGGNPSGCVDGSGATLTTDQRGFVRPSGTECDIGAVEAVETDLSIVKTANDESFVIGDEITYTLTVTNNGPGISPAIASDALPSAVSLVSIDAGCSESGGTVTCDLGDLDPGESASATIVVEAISEGTVDNMATVFGADIDTDPSNDSSTATVTIQDRNVPPGFEFRGGGCSIGGLRLNGSPLGWTILGIGLISIAALRRRIFGK